MRADGEMQEINGVKVVPAHFWVIDDDPSTARIDVRIPDGWKVVGFATPVDHLGRSPQIVLAKE